MKTDRIRMIGAMAFCALMLAAAVAWARRPNTAFRLDHADPKTQEPAFDQNAKITELTKSITGKEGKPSGEVFKNVQILKAVPAGRLLKIMELGYSKSLGVNCTHCHVVDQWDKDDKPTKQIAREMIKMTNAINNDYLKNIKNLKGPNPIINCTTCHRGQVKPALNLS
jgi:Photosynthetic reaction centre cytochrome C subunit